VSIRDAERENNSSSGESSGGWFRVPNALLDVYGERLGANGIAVYVALARYYPRIFPGLKKVAALTGLCERSVMRAIRALEAAGIIRVERQSGKGNRYQCILVTGDCESPVNQGHGTGDCESPDQCTTVTTPVTHSHPNKTYLRRPTNNTSQQDIAADGPPPVPPKRSETLQALGEGQSPSETILDTSDTSNPKKRQRDELFDAVAEVTASDPKASGSFVGRVCKALRSADPPYTPEEVRRFAANVQRESWWQGGPPSLGYIEKNIGRVRAQQTPPGQNNRTPRGPTHAAQRRSHRTSATDQCGR
jgi:hypothetical protein